MALALQGCDHVFSDTTAIGVNWCALCRKPMLRAIKCKRCRLKCHPKCSGAIGKQTGCSATSMSTSTSASAKKGMDVFPSVRHRVSAGTDPRYYSTCSQPTPSQPTPMMTARVQVGQASAVPSGELPLLTAATPRGRDTRSCSVPAISFDRITTEGRTFRLSPPRVNAAVMERRTSSDGTEDINPDAKIEEVEEFCIPFDGMQFEDKAGQTSRGNVYFGKWHGEVLIHTRPHQTIEDVQEFWREVSMLSSIRHENIELFMGACMTPPHLAVLTCSHKAASLHKTLHLKLYKLPMANKMKIIKEISQGMSYLHSKGIVHANLNSHAIYLENRVLISMSTFTPVNHIDDSDNDKEMLCYLSPEMLMALRLETQDMMRADCVPTRQSDAFAFGTLLYETFREKYPYSELIKENMIVQIVRGYRENLDQLSCPEEVKTFISLCWAQDPEYRPTFQVLLKALSQKVCTLGNRHHSFSEPSQLDKLGKVEMFDHGC